MADGDNLRVGRNHTGTATTRLDRSGGATNTAFDVVNRNGDGIRGEASVASPPTIPGEHPVGPRPPGIVEVSQPGTGVVGTGNTGVEGSGSQIGVRGSAPQGIGVSGDSNSSVGVAGKSNTGYGLHGRAQQGIGVYGGSSSDVGVYGQSGGGAPGVHGLSPDTAGVQGRSAHGVGVSGQSDNQSALAGISLKGHGVVGTTFAQKHPAVMGVSAGRFGVAGHAEVQTADTPRVGVFGMARPPAGAHWSTAIGVFGNSPEGQGVFGATTGSGWGGHFLGVANAQGAGGFGGALLVTGDLLVMNGVKSAGVQHPDGSHRLLYCMESPESWFEDFGSAELAEGRARVELDEDFAAVVRTEGEEYYVFLTPEGDSNGLYVSDKSPTGFEVREQQGGSSSLRFSYRVVAKRKDVEAQRLAKVEPVERVDVDELLAEVEIPQRPEPFEEFREQQPQPSQEETSLS